MALSGEKELFLQLCSISDQKKLNNQSPMTYDDFERFSYILDVLRFREYGIDFFDFYLDQFESEVGNAELEIFDLEKEAVRYTKWLIEFRDQITDPVVRHLVTGLFEID